MADGGWGKAHNARISGSQTKQTSGKEESSLDSEAPSPWWFASTGFPLLAGTFGPMASAFSVCALVENWVEHASSSQKNGHGVDVPDPGWHVGVNAVSLAFALVANLALLLRMASCLSFLVAQPTIILGWYTASFLLIAPIAVTASRLHSPGTDYAFTQAFYYAAFAASLYFIISSLMAVSVYGAYSRHYSREFRLTMGQLSLMLRTISFNIYLLGGAAVFHRVEGWRFLDSVYWADYTILTVGIGDYAPKTHLGRSLLFPYGVGGVTLLGLVIGSIKSFISDRSKRKLNIKIEKKHQSLLLKQWKPEPDIPVPRLESPAFVKTFNRAISEEEFNAMRNIQHKVRHRHSWNLFLGSGIAWFFLWLVSAAVFKRAEHQQNWSYFQALYFTYTSLMTIGYGDLFPTSNFSKPFFVFWSLLAVPTLTVLIGTMGDTIIQRIRDVAIRVGELTLMGRESGLKGTLKHMVVKATEGRYHTDQASNVLNGNRKKSHKDSGRHHLATETDVQGNQKGKQNGGSDAGKSGERLGQDTDYYHYLLVKEMGNVAAHLRSSLIRQYSYEEWNWFLTLINAGGDAGRFRESPSEEEEVENKGQDQKRERPDCEHNEQGLWSWFDSRGPLLSEKEEPAWVLEHLAATLKRGLERKLDRRTKFG